MYFLHRREVKILRKCRARHFRAPSVASRFLEAQRCFYGPHAQAGVHSQHLLEYRMPSGIGLSTHFGASLRVWCTFIERYPGASEARDGTSDAHAALLSRADEISRCSCPIIELQIVSDSQRVFTAQCNGLSVPRPPIIRHRIISHNELQNV